MTRDQFEALHQWIIAEIEARMVRHSAGPHVSEIKHAAELARDYARAILTEE